MNAQLKKPGLIHPVPVAGTLQQERRLAEYFGKYRRQSMETLQTADNQSKKIASLNKEKEALQRELAEIKNSRLYKIKSFMKR